MNRVGSLAKRKFKKGIKANMNGREIKKMNKRNLMKGKEERESERKYQIWNTKRKRI